MSVSDWYQEYLRKQQEQNNGFRGYSDPVKSAINREVFNSYMNQGNDAQQVQKSQKNGASLSSTAGKVAEGFAKGGPIGAIVAAAQAVKKAGKNARRNAQAMGKQTMQNAEQQNKALMADNEIPTAQTPQFNPNDYMVGGAAPVQDINSQVYDQYMNNPQNDAIQSAINANTPDQGILNQSIVADNAAPLNAEVSQDEVKKGLLDKFISGVSDFSRGYQENRNNGFDPNNLKADKFTETVVNPADTQKIADYQNGLQNDANYNAWAERAGVNKDEAIKAIAEGKNSGNADVDKWIKNNPDAYNETKTTKTYDKGKMARLGEALGTMGRVAQNPLVQGLVAGGLSAALTGNPLYGLGQGYKFANNRAMSDIYSNALKQYGFDVPNVGMFGNLDNKDFNALMMPQYKQAMTDLAQAKLLEQQNYHNQMIENQKNLNEIRQQNADTNAYKAQNGSKVTHVSTGGGKKTGGSSSQYQLVNGKDGNVYKLNKATGEYVIVGKEGVGSKGNQTIPETEEEFRNRVFKNKKGSSSDKGWAF